MVQIQTDCCRSALIVGISGQDGAYLADFLLRKGYRVWGTSRSTDPGRFKSLEALGILDKVKLIKVSPERIADVIQAIEVAEPREMYNLSGQSSVGSSFYRPVETFHSVALSTWNQLEAIRTTDKSIRFLNAGSGEMYGNNAKEPAIESTVTDPISPYAISKEASFKVTRLYRDAYGLFACTGILFNHESPLRSDNFVTSKVVGTARKIANGELEKLVLGDVSVIRDWGWAPEYVDAMWRILAQSAPDDFVIATGCAQSLEEFVRCVFRFFNLDWEKYVESDPSLRRTTDPRVIRADPSKAERLLQWRAKVTGSCVARMLCEES